MSNIKERVLQFADCHEGNKQTFFRKVGLNYGNFTGKSKESDLNSSSLEQILTAYPELNPIWLITGKQEMLKADLVMNGGTAIIGSEIDVKGKRNKVIDNSINSDNDLKLLCQSQEIEIKHLNTTIEMYKEQVKQLKELIELYKK